MDFMVKADEGGMNFRMQSSKSHLLDKSPVPSLQLFESFVPGSSLPVAKAFNLPPLQPFPEVVKWLGREPSVEHTGQQWLFEEEPE